MRVAPTWYALSKWTNACCRQGKKKVSVTPNLLHERQVWRAIYCRSMVIKGVATVAVDTCAAEGVSAQYGRRRCWVEDGCTFCCRDLRSGALVGLQGELVKGVLYHQERKISSHSDPQ